MSKKRLATGYTFVAAAKTVAHADFSDITLAGIQLIINVTDQIIIYNFADTAKGGTLATDTLTLEYDTTSMSDTDELMILVEDGSATQPISAASLPLPTGAATSAKQDTIIGHVDGVETLLGTIDTDTGAIATSVASIDTKTPALGQALAAASVPVVLTAAQITTLTPVSTVTANAGTDLNTSALLTTAAHDAAFGTSGTADAQVRSIQGIASMTPVQVSQATASNLNATVVGTGTFATQVDGAALTALQLIDDPVFADDAAYTLSTSKGGVAAGVAVQTDGTDPTAVSAEGDASALRTDMNRILLVNTTPPRLTSATENNATAQTNNPILSAPGASLSLYITDIVVSNGATAGSIKFVEDTGGTPVIKVQETYMAINGGAVMSFKTPIRITANKDFGYTSTTVTTHSITVNGYIAP